MTYTAPLRGSQLDPRSALIAPGGINRPPEARCGLVHGLAWQPVVRPPKLPQLDLLQPREILTEQYPAETSWFERVCSSDRPFRVAPARTFPSRPTFSYRCPPDSHQCWWYLFNPEGRWSNSALARDGLHRRSLPPGVRWTRHSPVKGTRANGVTEHPAPHGICVTRSPEMSYRKPELTGGRAQFARSTRVHCPVSQPSMRKWRRRRAIRMAPARHLVP
jgi:hypothetical protein